MNSECENKPGNSFCAVRRSIPAAAPDENPITTRGPFWQGTDFLPYLHVLMLRAADHLACLLMSARGNDKHHLIDLAY